MLRLSGAAYITGAAFTCNLVTVTGSSEPTLTLPIGVLTLTWKPCGHLHFMKALTGSHLVVIFW